MRKIIIFAFLCVCVPFLLQAGTKEEIEKVQRYVLDLQKQLWDLQESTFKSNQQIIKLLDDLNKQIQATQANQSKLSNQLDALVGEIQTIKAKLEDTNQRLANIGSRAQDKTGTPSPDGNQNVNVAPPPDTKEEEMKALYQTAYGDYQRGKYDLAISGFQDFIKKYAQSDLADNAQYWIGESYYSKNNYLDAIIEFENLIKKYPGSDRIATAHFKKALAYLKLEKKAQAVVELQLVVQQFSDTNEAQLAKQQLKELGFE